MTHHPKMRRFSKIMVVRFISYLGRAVSDGYNDTSMLFIVILLLDFRLLPALRPPISRLAS